jgi:hypothetical protein
LRDALDRGPNAVQFLSNDGLILRWKVHIDRGKLVFDDVSQYLTDFVDRRAPDLTLAAADASEDHSVNQSDGHRDDGHHLPVGPVFHAQKVWDTECDNNSGKAEPQFDMIEEGALSERRLDI